MIITANILDVFTNQIYPAEIIVEEGLIADVIPIIPSPDFELDFKGVLLPGFIDSHIHIESSNLSPSEFAKVAVRHGTTSVIADPHEIANVGGIKGIDFMIENSKEVPFDFYFSAPSCVPATSFESSGAVLNSEDVEEILKKDNVVALAEMMNFPGVLSDDEEVLKKLEIAKSLNKPIDGHAPLLLGKDLEKYISAGISTDHECAHFDEAIEKKLLGMKIMVTEGSSSKHIDDLFNYEDRLDYWRNDKSFGRISNDELKHNLESPIFDFIVSDDKNPIDLLNGHLNESIKKAALLDINIKELIKMITINPATHYGLNSGAISPGRRANFVLIDNFIDFNIMKTFIGGVEVFDGEKVLFDSVETEFENTFNLSKKEASDFDIKTNIKDEVNVRVIKAKNGTLLTEESQATLKVQDGIIQSDLDNDILKLSTVERYGGNTIANAFINGFNLKKGAIASSVSHDSHNIVVVGTNSQDMANAVNLISENHGGFAIVDGDNKYSLALPIAGLMTNKPCDEVANGLNKLHLIAKELGCSFDAPFMTLSFMSLLVIPSLKLSNLGLFDGIEFNFTNLILN